MTNFWWITGSLTCIVTELEYVQKNVMISALKKYWHISIYKLKCLFDVLDK